MRSAFLKEGHECLKEPAVGWPLLNVRGPLDLSLSEGMSAESLLPVSGTGVGKLDDISRAIGRGVERWQQRVAMEFHTKASPLKDFYFHLATQASPEKPLRVVLISAFYYAALSAKLVKKGDKTYAYMPAIKAAEMLQAYIKRACLECEVSEALANIVRLDTVISLLFGAAHLQNVELLFARDWEIRGCPFRTTWTTGW